MAGAAPARAAAVEIIADLLHRAGLHRLLAAIQAKAPAGIGVVTALGDGRHTQHSQQIRVAGGIHKHFGIYTGVAGFIEDQYAVDVATRGLHIGDHRIKQDLHPRLIQLLAQRQSKNTGRKMAHIALIGRALAGLAILPFGRGIVIAVANGHA